MTHGALRDAVRVHLAAAPWHFILLTAAGINVIVDGHDEWNTHASGHAYRDEISRLVSLLRPKVSPGLLKKCVWSDCTLLPCFVSQTCVAGVS